MTKEYDKSRTSEWILIEKKEGDPIRTRYDRQATEKRILSTCVRLFLEQGFSNTPPKQIFEEADVSAGTFYHLYKSKSDVLADLTQFMFGNQFNVAGKIVGENPDPVLLYAVETSIQLTLAELNEVLREVYVEVYTQPNLVALVHQKTAPELQKIFGSYLPDTDGSGFYEIEIGTAGIMRAYMARPCDVYFTLERKLNRFLRTTLNIFEVPEDKINAAIQTINSLDIRSIANEVMRQLFRMLEMEYQFTLSAPDAKEEA